MPTKNTATSKNKNDNANKPNIPVEQDEWHAEQNTMTAKKYEDIHFVDSTKPVWNYSLFSEEDIRNFQNGTHYRFKQLS